jgi:hypothetical protein
VVFPSRGCCGVHGSPVAADCRCLEVGDFRQGSLAVARALLQKPHAAQGLADL